MSKTMISARIPEVLDRKLEAIAAAERRSKSFIVEEALQLYAEREAWMIARAEASARRAEMSGQWYSDDVVMEWFSTQTSGQISGQSSPFPKPDAGKAKP